MDFGVKYGVDSIEKTILLDVPLQISQIWKTKWAEIQSQIRKRFLLIKGP